MTSNWMAILRLQSAACRPEAQGSQCCKFWLIPKAWDLGDPQGTSQPVSEPRPRITSVRGREKVVSTQAAGKASFLRPLASLEGLRLGGQG